MKALLFAGMLTTTAGAGYVATSVLHEARSNVVAWGSSGSSVSLAPVVDVRQCVDNMVTVNPLKRVTLVAVSHDGAVDCAVLMGETAVASGDNLKICATSVTGGGALSLAPQAGVLEVPTTVRLAANRCVDLIYSVTGAWVPAAPLQPDTTLCIGCRANRTVTASTVLTAADDVVRVIRPGTGATANVTLPVCDAALNGKTFEVVPQGTGLGTIALVGGVNATIRGLVSLTLLGTTSTMLTCNGAGDYIARP